ncbi:hypothetical protein MLD38_033646 [Melastoma candidum]|uniref:Uncharacterized protein n=1 Tax=Melastoma candidum TaxID=119954 RepID=A0ACB9M805_9MYRT|nr:hypothetical protein MLD38_033646 [Melastoma candidum]
MCSGGATGDLTFLRLKDRILYRSSDDNELVQLRKESENNMKRCLGLIWFCWGSVVGSGIFVLTGQEAHDHFQSCSSTLCPHFLDLDFTLLASFFNVQQVIVPPCYFAVCIQQGGMTPRQVCGGKGL